jgi:PAS domain-containing protein
MNQLARTFPPDSLLEDSLSNLSSLQFENTKNLNKTLSFINEEVCKSLSIHRCGIWLFDHSKTELRCEDIFDTRKGEHFSGLEISLSNSPYFLHLVQSKRVYSVSNVEGIDYLEEFSNRHLSLHDIRAIISSGIYVKGELVGILAGSVIGSAYNWQSIDRLYFSSAADIVSRIFTRFTDSTYEPSSHKISLRRLVKELSSLCSQASLLSFRDAAQKGLESINNIIGASGTHAIVIEKDKTYVLSNRGEPSLTVSIEAARKIHLLVSNSHPIWIQDTGAAINELPGILSGLGLKPSHAALICPFGTLDKQSKESIRGVIIIEFRHPAPIWNDGLREVLLSASDAFSILSEYAYAKSIHKENAELARAAFKSSSIGMVIFSDKGEIIRLNESFSRMFHAPPGEPCQPFIGDFVII